MFRFECDPLLILEIMRKSQKIERFLQMLRKLFLDERCGAAFSIFTELFTLKFFAKQDMRP